MTWILYPFLIIDTSIQFASIGTRYDYHQHQIHLTQAIFASDTYPRWNKLFKPSKPSLTILVPKNLSQKLFPSISQPLKIKSTHTHQPRWQAALNRTASLLLVDSLTTCPGLWSGLILLRTVKILLAKFYELVIGFLVFYWDLWVLDFPLWKSLCFQFTKT